VVVAARVAPLHAFRCSRAMADSSATMRAAAESRAPARRPATAASGRVLQVSGANGAVAESGRK